MTEKSCDEFTNHAKHALFVLQACQISSCSRYHKEVASGDVVSGPSCLCRHPSVIGSDIVLPLSHGDVSVHCPWRDCIGLLKQVEIHGAVGPDVSV